MDPPAPFPRTLCDISAVCPLGHVTSLGAQDALMGKLPGAAPSAKRLPPAAGAWHPLVSNLSAPVSALWESDPKPTAISSSTCPHCLSGLSSHRLFCSVHPEAAGRPTAPPLTTLFLCYVLAWKEPRPSSTTAAGSGPPYRSGPFPGQALARAIPSAGKHLPPLPVWQVAIPPLSLPISERLSLGLPSHPHSID